MSQTDKLEDLIAVLDELKALATARDILDENNFIQFEVAGTAGDVIYDNRGDDGINKPWREYMDMWPVGHMYRLPALINAASSLCDSLLISGEGRSLFGENQRLGMHEYRVRAGEQDGFGWLTGIVYCEGFSFVYG